MKGFVAEGDVVGPVTAPYAVTSGDGMLVGAQLFGIAISTYANADPKAQIRTRGVFDVKKVSAQAWAVGDLIYWDNAAKLFTTVSAGNTLRGTAVAIAANPTAIGRLRLSGT